ncbi:tetratricopeptide repeat protein [Flavobacterium sp. RHBU_24]|uniref:tetratricopeptide repeat-containing sensor histidine kinase n=1 Tax=Flavobacterium sp. RHBU_24 TaxID=3391185 RepID=UPI003984C599
MKLLKILPALLFLCVLQPAFSQDKVLDSLFNKLKAEKNDSTRVRLINLIASEYTGSDPAKVIEYGNKGLALAQKYKLQQHEADAWFNVGNGNILLSKYADAIKCFSNSQGIYENLFKTDKRQVITDGLARAYGSIGVVCNEQNNYPKALEYFFKALKLYRDSKQEDIAARIYSGIGVVYESEEDYDKALFYYNKSLALKQNTDDEVFPATYSNLGNVYLALNKDDKALSAYKSAEKILSAQPNARVLGELYNNYGNYYRKKGDLKKSADYYKKALEIFTSTGYLFGASATQEYLGRIAEKENRYAEAINYYNKSSENATLVGANGQVKDSEKALSDLYEKQGRYKEAYEHYKKYSVANDSVIGSDNIKALVREEMNFEFERKDEQRKLEIEKKQALYNEKVKRHRLQTIFGGVIVMLALGFIFLVYNRRQIKKTLTLQRDLAEYEQKALHLQMNPHFVFNCLGAISGFIVQNGTDSALKYLAKFSKLMRLTLEYSKESLIPIDKEIESLKNYLELEQLRFNHIFDFTITKDSSIEDDVALPPLLIQPFVENAIIHGIVPKLDKGAIGINFTIEGNTLVCTITDDGIGLEKSRSLKENSVTVHKSMALEITRKRLEVIEAYTAKKTNVNIEDVENESGKCIGTKITLYLPVQYLSGT